MKRCTSAIVALTVWMSLPARAVSPGYSQVYTIFIKGAPAGTETVSEEWDKNGNLISHSESVVFLSDGLDTKRMAFKTRLVLSKGSLAPMSYSYKYTTGNFDGYDVVVKNGSITRVLTRAGRSTESTLPVASDVVILDFNVYHHFDYVIRKYDSKRGGRQTFKNFLPLVGAEVPMSIIQREDSKLDYPKTSIAVRNFKIEVASIWSGSVSIDPDGRLVRLSAPGQDVEVVRRDLLPESQLPPATPKNDKDGAAEKKLPA